jgi:hypothetical protein
MKFNIAYLGPVELFNLRRDFILCLKYSLEDLGHECILSGLNLDEGYVNLIIGAYFLPSSQIEKIYKSGIKYININTEIIADGMLNHNPAKVDLIGAYVPLIRGGLSAWDVTIDNISEYSKYDVEGNFLRWGYHPKMREINQERRKDLDFYFFGSLSERRRKIITMLQSEGLRGGADGNCPYFVRNDYISRSKVQLNLMQDEKYTHVNSFRICYLANNSCYILSEKENDAAGYLNFADVVDSQNELGKKISDVIKSNSWASKAEANTAIFEKNPMTDILMEILDKSFS